MKDKMLLWFNTFVGMSCGIVSSVFAWIAGSMIETNGYPMFIGIILDNHILGISLTPFNAFLAPSILILGYHGKLTYESMLDMQRWDRRLNNLKEWKANQTK